MKKEDIKAGDVIWHNQGSYGWLFRVTKVDGNKYHYSSYMRKARPEDNKMSYFTKAHGNPSWDTDTYPLSDLRYASLQEITWLEACEKENRFVPCPKSFIIDNYTLI